MSSKFLIVATLLLVVPVISPAAIEVSVDAALREIAEAEFVDTPLNEAMETLSASHRVPIVLDESAFKKAGVPLEEPVNLILKGVSLRSLLNLITYQQRAEWRVERGRIVVAPESAKKPAPPAKVDAIVPDPPSVQKIKAALKDETDFEFDGTPLKECLAFLGDVHQVPIFLDERGLAERKIETDAPITAKSKPATTLAAGLDSFLTPHGLRAIVRDEVIFVTTVPKKEAGMK